MSRLLSLRLLFCVFSAFFIVSIANAQASIYGTGVVGAYGLKQANSSTFYFKSGAPGFLVGGFYNFPIDSRVTVGIDARLTENPGTKGGTAGAAALRIGFVPHQVPLKPYLEIGGGVIRTSTNTELVNDQVRAGTYTNGSAIFAFGLDIRITRSVDIRALDIGSQAGGMAGVVYADSGVVYHFGTR